jgi:hypothetical protein
MGEQLYMRGLGLGDVELVLGVGPDHSTKWRGWQYLSSNIVFNIRGLPVTRVRATPAAKEAKQNNHSASSCRVELYIVLRHAGYR